MLIDSRQQQIHDKEHFYAVQAKQDREEFNRVLRYAAIAMVDSKTNCRQDVAMPPPV